MNPEEPDPINKNRKEILSMIAVGIDVSKSKSTVAILNGDGSIRAKPFEVRHTADELHALVSYIIETSEPPTILMEPTSHYHYPLLKAFQEANLPICLINPSNGSPWQR